MNEDHDLIMTLAREKLQRAYKISMIVLNQEAITYEIYDIKDDLLISAPAKDVVEWLRNRPLIASECPACGGNWLYNTWYEHAKECWPIHALCSARNEKEKMFLLADNTILLLDWRRYQIFNPGTTPATKKQFRDLFEHILTGALE